ncbi:MAG: hypothetical protein CMM93_01740 [Rickettsiales bacterium]|nr:hypothetical protein [Rickettsiales bacterium]
MSLTPQQAIEILNTQSDRLNAKINYLANGARFYKVAALFTALAMGVPALINIGLESYFISDPEISSSTRRALFIVLLSLQVFALVFTIVDKVVHPSTKAAMCSTVSKAYSELNRELIIFSTSLLLEEQDTLAELVSKLLYYSTKEQLVLNDEPLLICIGRRKKAVFRQSDLPI